MDFLDRMGTPFKFDFMAGQGMVFNPMANFAAKPEWCLNMIQNAAQYELDGAKFDLARRIGLRVAKHQAPSVRALVDAWELEPALTDFADAVSKAMLPQ